ncbi:MAG: ferritin [Candidatus Marinimicrobia bacterium]|nr:ferritin [Candidatus Neomarinimicrobiota bacterium]MCF7828508.1 ferritin [Candidatus Neomarinimicrobiota bacterium]MCF7882069.1 ferritin [Candidatus Neomarinimicrobiota bacterium]
MISDKIEALLNDQIAKEFYASHYYLALASWCDTQGYEGAAHFFVAQSNEEREHGMRIFHYVNDMDGHAVAPEIEKPPVKFESFGSTFENALEQERQNTKAIHEIVDVSLEEKDYSTYNFMHWYLDEQVEEETLFKGILDKLNIIGDDKSGLYMLDKELGQRQGAPAAGEGEE